MGKEYSILTFRNKKHNLKDGYEKEKYYFCIPLTEKYYNH